MRTPIPVSVTAMCAAVGMLAEEIQGLGAVQDPEVGGLVYVGDELLEHRASPHLQWPVPEIGRTHLERRHPEPVGALVR